MNLFDIASWAFFLVAACSLYGFLRGAKPLALSLGAVLLFMVALGSPLAVNSALALLEARQSERSAFCNDAPDAPIVVLAGGISHPIQADPGRLPWEKLTPTSLSRVMGVLPYVSQSEPQAVIVSGGMGHDITEAQLMANLFAQMGVQKARLHLDDKGMSTYESAENVRALFAANNWPLKAILATSALHMLRAQASFQKQGFEICPYAVDYQRQAVDSGWGLVPQSGAMVKMQQLLHEVFGYAYYALRGKL